MNILPRPSDDKHEPYRKIVFFNYLGEYFQLPWGVCSTTLGSIFNYLGEYFQLPWGVFSATLGSIFSYLGEYFQLSWGTVKKIVSGRAYFFVREPLGMAGGLEESQLLS